MCCEGIEEDRKRRDPVLCVCVGVCITGEDTCIH